MSLERLLNHTCDIYHIVEGTATPGFGLPSSPSFSYPAEPDISGQTCHFGVRSRNASVTQTAPVNYLDERYKITFPLGTDVRLNDKIIDRATGLEYTAEVPVNVRDHHIFVYAKLKGEDRNL